MRRMKKWLSLIAAVALCLTGIPVDGMSMDAQAADEVTVDSTVRLKPSEASTFNDTNGDGLGEFEGWGTSLCWWANRIGYSEKLTSEAAKLFFSDEGLDMNIGRYNVGGGDHVGEVSSIEVPVNEKAKFYDLSNVGENPTFGGKQMKVSSFKDLANATYNASDADFGITKGNKVGKFDEIGWINELGGTVGDGDNLRYTVEAKSEGAYTVKLLMEYTTGDASDKRDAALLVNDADEYVKDGEAVAASAIASSGNSKLYLITFTNVALKAGTNTINVAGKSGWTLNFVKMAVIKSGDEGVLPETDEFLHAEHIVRSDSGVPGYAVDVTKIDPNKDISDYADFDRADAECGYAWNYNWDADKNQINILKAAAAASGTDFIAEAFSNSPPYFMTVSGCSSGNTDSNRDNLRADSVNAFAAYMADVIEHWSKNGITFQSTDPMNEPYTNYWGANSNKQEGCHFDQGESQSRILVALKKELNEKGLGDIIICATDETSIDTAITSWNALSDEAKAVVERIDTHTYGGSDRAGLKETAKKAGKNLWMSEVDGAYTGGTNSGEMSAALGLAQRMMTDVNGMKASAWILWNAIDMHADSSEYGQSWVNKGSSNDYLSMDALEAAWKSRTSNGYWGFAAADHDKEEIVLSMKYYGYGQLSRYIRPGYTIIGTSKGTTLAAYDPEGKKAVVVAMNTSGADKTWKFDLSGFETMGDKITAIRTSGSMDNGEKWADVTDSDNIVADTENNSFTATMKANSITTYIIEGVSGIKEVSEAEHPVVKQIPVSADQVTGTAPWNNGTVNVAAKVVDGDYSTFFDGVLNGYVILDLQEAKEIAAVSWAPRDGYADRCVGAIISGSNDGNTWTNLYTIEEVPAKGKDTFAYYTDFNTTEHTYRYIKYWVPDDGKSNCNLSELKVYESAPGIESQKAVSAATYNGSEPKLPAKVEVTLSNGETAEIPVKWDLSEIDISYDEMELFDSVTVTGTSTEANGTVTGYIICAPDNLEYLIDCMTGDSEIPTDGKYVSAAWTAARGLDSLLNTNSSDQKKTDDKAWGYTTNSGLNSWAYAMGNDLYGFGYWAGDGASIEYQLALPEGEHDIMLGCYDFWSGRTMNVYYKVGDGEKQLLCELESNHNTGSTSGGTITLEEDADVTLSVEKGKGGDPVLSWISVAKKKSSEENTMKAHYDMSHNGSSLTDISGNGNNATLYDTSDADFGVYEGEEVLQFNNKQYATLPKGIITDGGSFTVQAVVSAPTQGDNWVWCIGDGIGTWGDNNVGNHIFMSANSSQGNYGGSVLGAVMVGKVQGGGEARMPVPSQKLGSGYTTITMVSDGQTLIMYMDGKEVSRLEGHGKDVSQIIPDGDILGYIGRSLYSPDKKLIANVADIKIWDEALTAKKVSKAVPSAEEKMNMVLADIQKVMLNGNASVNEIETNIKLPGSVDGYDLTWTIPENEAIAQDGKVTIPLEDVNVDVKVEYGDGQEATFALTVPGENIDKILDTAAAELDIPNKDDVRGNITLPAETESKVAITWTTSHPDIVDVNAQEEKVEGYGQVPAGVVTRPAEDTEVTMTATLNYKDATKTKEIKLQVKAAPEKITEKDYTDYFFAYFAGEGYSDGEQIYFASSQDGMNWDDLNNNKPVLTSTLGEEGVRDPFIIRSPEGDKFYMIATDLKIYNGNGWDAAQNRGSQSLMVWESTDLVNWSEQRMVEVSADIEAGCTWAPEATYDPATGEYVVYWASRTPKLDNKQRLYYAKTRDFYTFTTPQLYIEKDQSSIDTTMIEENGTYYRYTKNEGGETNELGAKTKTIFLEKSNNVLGTFESIPSDSLNKYQWVEGPTIFKLNEDDATDTAKWCLLVDEFSAGGYYPLLASDLSTGEFVRPEAGTYKMPSRARHGTPIRVTSDEYAKIMAAYATPDKVNVATTAGTAPTLPETVMVGKTEENVTWKLEGVSFEADAYQIVQVTGTTDSGKEAIANVQVIPTNVEYMIDCANEGSQTWKNAAALNTGILNAGTADQEKTDDNTWGYVSTISESGDMAIYSGSSITDPYEGGYWARGGKNISYQVTLPAGEHTFMFGANGNWWSQGRKMKVYYSVNGSEEKELCDFIQTKNVKSYSTGTLTLSEKAVVTLTVKKNGNADPVLSWITVCGTPDKPDVIDYTELKNQIKAAKALKESDYTPASFAAVTTALNQAEALLNNAADQDEADAAASALADAISGLVEAADFTELQKYYDANKDIQGSYTEESYTKYVNARNAAAAVLENKNAAQAEVDEALENLKAAVEALEEIQKVDKTELKKLYDKCKAIEQGNYTEESYQALQDALKVAKEVLDNENATESDLKVGYEKLAGAYSGLKEKEPVDEVNKDELQKQYEEYSVIEKGSYTEKSYQALQKALENAKKVLSDKDASEADVNEAYAELQKAYEGLEKEVVVVVNKDELQKLYDAYKAQKQGDYTDASYKAFTKALKEAKAVLENKDATQKEVNAAYSALYDAVKGLTKKGGNAKPGVAPSGSSQTSNTTKTGDTAPVMSLVVVALAAALVAIVMFVKRRRVNK